MKSFALKVKHFFKRNIYPITVTMCTVLVLGIIAISAYSAISKQNNVVDTNSGIEQNNPPDNASDEDKKEEDKKDQPTGSDEPIIFDLPFENAEVSKAYADNILIYDKTTKFWCTHQGIDFSCSLNQEVKAVFGGKVVKVESSMMNGTVVYLQVSDDLTVVYKGLASDLKVKEGDTIKKGAVIGKVASFLSEKGDGVHLHLELLKGDKLIDPTDYFPFNK